MREALMYFVVEDELILMEAPFQLDAGQMVTFVAHPEGAMYRLEVEQALGHPGNSMPSVSIEGCGEDEEGNIHVGFINQYPQNDNDHYIDIDCRENVGSFDPNDKQGFPKGYGEQKFIAAETPLEYLIRFQNTGTDTAFTVVIKDDLSPFLDISTLKPGASSHDYDFKIMDERTLVFTFDNIMLPDSNVNEAASHGFITYNVQQKKDNADGTIIKNEAAIFFDFNAPVITNTTVHTVGSNFVSIAPPNFTWESNPKPVIVKAYPNPFEQYLTFEILHLKPSELTFYLYDLKGRLIQEIDFISPTFEFERGNLDTGMYIFEIKDKKQLIGNGKIVLGRL